MQSNASSVMEFFTGGSKLVKLLATCSLYFMNRVNDRLKILGMILQKLKFSKNVKKTKMLLWLSFVNKNKFQRDLNNS